MYIHVHVLTYDVLYLTEYTGGHGHGGHGSHGGGSGNHGDSAVKTLKEMEEQELLKAETKPLLGEDGEEEEDEAPPANDKHATTEKATTSGR